MTHLRPFSVARFVIAAAVALFALVPATSGAVAPDWFTPQTLSGAADGAYAGGDTYFPAVASAPDGSVSVIWGLGTGDIWEKSRSAATGEWTLRQVNPGEPAGGYIGAVDDDGNLSVLWGDNPGGQPTKLEASTRLAGSGEWSAPQVTTNPGDVFGEGAVARGANGTLVAVFPCFGTPNRIRIFMRAKNSPDWTEDPTGIEFPADAPTGHMALAFNERGDGVLVTGLQGSPYTVETARYSPTTGWTSLTPIPDATYGSNPNNISVAMAPGGAATAVWNDGGGGHRAYASTMDVESGVWSASEAISPAGEGAVLTQIQSDGANHFVAVWQRNFTGGSPIVESKTLTIGGAWDAEPAILSNESLGGAPTLAANRAGAMVVSFLSSENMSDFQVGAAYRAAGASQWSPYEIVLGSGADPASHGFPSAGIDAAGNPVVAFSQYDGSHYSVGFAAKDVAGPQLAGLSVPAAGVVGDEVTVSVNPFDVWSAVGETTVNFGDGAQGTIDPLTHSVSHTYTAAGDYSVGVAATNALGMTSTATRALAIAAAPAPDAPSPSDEDTPPVVRAPVIEARLSGKTIRLTARVTLRPGRRCTGQATATTRFGTTTYRSTLKLATVDGVCVGTGTIKLKKTPSARTKLRVSVSSKNTKPRTVTTKRA